MSLHFLVAWSLSSVGMEPRAKSLEELFTYIAFQKLIKKNGTDRRNINNRNKEG